MFEDGLDHFPVFDKAYDLGFQTRPVVRPVFIVGDFQKACEF
jgi:hypothetical protein